MKINKQIEVCFKSIQTLYKFLAILGAGLLGTIGIFSFITSTFGVIASKGMVVFESIVILNVIILIFSKFAIIKKLRKGDSND
jgi:hypothetical protein